MSLGIVRAALSCQAKAEELEKEARSKVGEVKAKVEAAATEAKSVSNKGDRGECARFPAVFVHLYCAVVSRSGSLLERAMYQKRRARAVSTFVVFLAVRTDRCKTDACIGVVTFCLFSLF